jgi:hypothetical protein
MRALRTTLSLLLVVGTTACTAFLGATDVPDPATGQDAGGLDSTVGGSDTGPPDLESGSGHSSGGGASSTGGSSSGVAEASSGSPEASVDAAGSPDGPPDASAASDDGPPESSASQPDATDDSGCGPLTTASNCGACGVVCDTSTGSPSCVGTTCTYMCNPGHLDCNAVNGPDTDGCECTTPACCGTSCQTTHDDGLGQSFYDCSPIGTHTAQSAMEACQAYAMGISGNAAACSTGYYCTTHDEEACYAPGGNGTVCWGYRGSTLGQVTDFSCPSNISGTWN